MRLHFVQHKLRQNLYKPTKSRFFTKDAIKDWEDLDKSIEETLSGLTGVKKDKKEDKKADKK